MKVVTNDKLIKRNQKIGNISSLASLGILVLGFVLSFNPDQLTWAFAALLLGFIVSQVGLFFGARFGRSPRPDEHLTAALKGLENRYTLYHYTTPVSHLLVGPSGAWVLLPYSQGGIIRYDVKKQRWQQKGGNLYLKIFAQDSLGRPDLDVKGSLNDAQKFLNEKLGQSVPVEVKAALVFTNPKVTIEAAEAPIPTLTAEKLKDFIRKQAKDNAFPNETFLAIQQALPTESVEA